MQDVMPHQTDRRHTVDSKAHWEHIYETKGADQVSWFEPEATVSLRLVQRVAPTGHEAIIDVGAGAATLVDGLLTAGYDQITVLDLSAAALAQAQRRLGERARSIHWREADVLSADLPSRAFDVWHDRAVFHFLTRGADRASYVAQVRFPLAVCRSAASS
jgi:trans-aconitate methyltransferase